MRKIFSAAVATIVLFSGPANAWDGILSGTVVGIETISTVGHNMDFRVYISGTAKCNGNSWAYIDSSAHNYNGIVATVLTAKVTKSSISVYANKDANGYCQIGDVSIS
ncbi:hypothetical protein [Collimonas pratensis]|uniref:hypothetical protein n=1 Tax=Collimonas pratensis TaxID=279113 RepID=UPI000AA323DC|nr:hypothetical protein [Collimonas pratensis]